MLSRFLCFLKLKSKNAVFSIVSEVEKVKIDFMCDKKLIHMHKNVTKF